MTSQKSEELRKAQWQADVMRNALKRKQINISTTDALNIVALLYDQESWDAWAAEEDEWKERFRRFFERMTYFRENDPKWK